MSPAYSVYAGTKGAVEQFARQLAKELAGNKSPLMRLHKGQRTPSCFMRQNRAAARRTEQVDCIGEPEDIANVIDFLVSEKSQWITGQTIRVHGGFI
ncbi:SDR family oxidoreductase [Bacillus sp. FSL K6-1005]|uniref:SDR family oxidoreductase n=1 Tax=Bacillus sp. FSL K6-1005 TaxID=2954676 RepID=UPI0030F6122B